MKKITIKNLTLRNFKGIKSFELTPSDFTSIRGANESGKTTLATAFTWLLWGKDLLDRKDFEIKTLDKNNNPIHKMEHEVFCSLDVDGSEVTLKRIYKEKWVKRHGTNETEMQGHETLFFWNDVPLKLNEYNAKIEEIFKIESVFKILSNPLFFNLQMKWEQRRSILIDIVGNVSDAELVTKNPDLKVLLAKLTNKSMDEYKAQIRSQKQTLNRQLESIPIRLDELDRNRPQEPDYAELEKNLSEIQEKVKNIDLQIQDKSEARKSYYMKREQYFTELGSLNDKLRKIEESASSKLREKENERHQKRFELEKKIDNIQYLIKSGQIAINSSEKRIADLLEKQAELRILFSDEAEKELTFDSDQFICPVFRKACGQTDYIREQRDEMLSNFNETKSKKLEEINKRGVSCRDEIAKCQAIITEQKITNKGYQSEESDLSSQLDTLKNTPVESKSAESILSDYENYRELKRLRDQLLANPVIEEPQDNSELELEKRTLAIQADQIKSQLNIREQIKLNDKRKVELQEEERKLAGEISVLQNDEYLIEQYTRAKVDELEGRVNKLFPSAKFRLFKEQINGGLDECCDTLINGVPYQAANSAAQVQSGIEIIGVLQSHYGLILPVIIDNRESVTEIPITQAQTISLYVDPSYKSLTVL